MTVYMPFYCDILDQIIASINYASNEVSFEEPFYVGHRCHGNTSVSPL